MAEPAGDVWMRCSACRKDIRFRAIHWVCSVSTCNRSRTRLVFCSVACWDSHVATLRHRDAWAVEARAPSREEHARAEADEARSVSIPTSYPSGGPPSAVPRAPAAASVPARPASEPGALPRPAPAPAPAPSVGSGAAHAGGPALSSRFDHDDMLIVVSKLKKYIRDRSGMNTSDAVAEVLGDYVRNLADDAIRTAAADGRKTVLDRDLPRPRR
jgi:hypothetical protein